MKKIKKVPECKKKKVSPLTKIMPFKTKEARKVRRKQRSKRKKVPVPVLGDKGYEPTNDEAKEFTTKANSSHARLRMYIFYICFYKTYKMEPYNCKTLRKFIRKHLEISRATVYRIYSVMCTRMTLKLNLKEHNDVPDSAFIRLGTLGRCIGDDGLNEFWDFLTNEAKEPITEDLVLFYINQYDRGIGLSPKSELPNDEASPNDVEPPDIIGPSVDIEPPENDEQSTSNESSGETSGSDTSFLNPKNDIDLLFAYQHSVNKFKSPKVVKVDNLIRKLMVGEMAIVLGIHEDYLSLAMDKGDDDA